MDAKASVNDPLADIEAVVLWDELAQSVTDADPLAHPRTLAHLHLVSEKLNTLRPYPTAFLEVLHLQAVPAAKRVLDTLK